MDNDELEDSWKLLRRPPLVEAVSDRPSDIKAALLIAAEKASYDLAQRCKEYHGQTMTPELLATIVSYAVKSLMGHWYDGLRSQDLAGLIEIILEGQKTRMAPEVMLRFVHALPDDILTRICQAAIHSSTGIHALMALEMARRTQGQQYTMTKVNGDVRISFIRDGQEIDFGLYDTFPVPDSG